MKGVLSLELFDIEAAEKAEKSIDEFISRRSKAKEKAKEVRGATKAGSEQVLAGLEGGGGA